VVGSGLLGVTVGRCNREPHAPCCRGIEVETDLGVVGKIHLEILKSTLVGSPGVLTTYQTVLQRWTPGESVPHHGTWAMPSQSKIEVKHAMTVGLLRTYCRNF